MLRCSPLVYGETVRIQIVPGGREQARRHPQGPAGRMRRLQCRFMRLLLLLLATSLLNAEDWPQWRGKDRLGVWTEAGILERFPADGPKRAWSQPIANGYAGPAVAQGRVFVTDYRSTGNRKGIERLLVLDEETGATLWSKEWAVDYAGLEYPLGPRATPTVDGDRVYALGSMGDLLCMRVDGGELLWQRNYQRDFAAELPTWGFVAAPLIDAERLIALVGGSPDAKVVALDKMTGEEIWRALDAAAEPGYDPPTIVEAGGVRQLIIWHPTAVASLNPLTGAVYWRQPFKIQAGLTVATPVMSRHGLLVSSFYNGSRMYRLLEDRPAAELIWKGNSNSEIETDGLHSLVTTPVVDGDHIYGIGSYGQLRCVDARTGARVWETLDLTNENARWASGQIVRHEDRYFINNDRGELIIARFTPEGYEELDRTTLMRPTNPLQRRREFGAVHWTHPSYANRHMIIRNDEEIVRFSLER